MSLPLLRSICVVAAVTLALSSSAEPVYNTPAGALSAALPLGDNSLAFPLKNPTAAVGLISGNTATHVSFQDSLPAFQAGRAYFIEIETGPFEGERLDIDLTATLGSPAGQVIVQTGVSSSTLSPLPASILAGSRASIRQHVTLGDLPEMFTPGLAGNLNAAQADGVRLFLDGALRTFFLRPDGTWFEVGRTVSETARILTPDTSLLVQLRSGPKRWKQLGQVRTHAFRLRLPVGERAIATGYPVALSPVQFGAYVNSDAPAGTHWTGNNAPGLADWLRVFDRPTGEFLPHTLRGDGRTWTRIGFPADLAHSPILTPTGMVILRRKQGDPDYLVLPPFDL